MITLHKSGLLAPALPVPLVAAAKAESAPVAPAFPAPSRRASLDLIILHYPWQQFPLPAERVRFWNIYSAIYLMYSLSL